jgi:ion channel
VPRRTLRGDIVRVFDSNATLLGLLLVNFFVLELVDNERVGAFVSSVIAGLALATAIYDSSTGRRLTRWQSAAIISAVILSAVVLLTGSSDVLGSAYLLPAVLVALTLPITLQRTLHHRAVTSETILGALCAYVLTGLVFAFVYIAISRFGADFFSQPGQHQASEYLYFSFVVLTTLGFGDLSPSVGLPQALVAVEALLGQIFLVTMVARLVTLWVRQSGSADATG